MAIQTSYDRDPAIGKPGQIARPDVPYWIQVGTTQVDSSERAPRPGDAVIRDNATGVNAFKVPGTAAEQLQICGIVAHVDNAVPRTNVAGASDAVQYLDGETIYVGVMGVFFVRVDTGGSESVSYGDRMTFDAPSTITDDGAWEAVSITALGGSADLAAVRTYLRAQPDVDIVAVNDAPIGANTEAIIPVKIGLGR